jgi:hypothetical protein
VEHLVGGKWIGDKASWYGLVTALSAPPPERFGRVAVTAASVTAGTVGRVWQVIDLAEASTVEVARVTRLNEIALS